MTRTVAITALVYNIADRLGPSWAVTGGRQLKRRIDADTQGIILFSVAGFERYTVTASIGPRFKSTERIVARAERAAGGSENAIRAGRRFPTMFERLSRVTAVPDYVGIEQGEMIVEAIASQAVPFIEQHASIAGAADYGATHPLAYGHHVVRLPVLLAQAGRMAEAKHRLDRLTSGADGDFLAAYAMQLRPLIAGL